MTVGDTTDEGNEATARVNNLHASPRWTVSGLKPHRRVSSNSSREDDCLHSDLCPNVFNRKSQRRQMIVKFSTHQTDDARLHTMRQLTDVCADIRRLRSQLHQTHGSIDFQIDGNRSTRSFDCLCRHCHSEGICQQISQFESELCRQTFVEYVYKIESLPQPNALLHDKDREINLEHRRRSKSSAEMSLLKMYSLKKQTRE